MISSLHRPTLAKVDLSAISENIEQVVSHIPKQVQTFAVVKANAYGHGAVAVAKHLSKQVDGFCVSNLDEALELRGWLRATDTYFRSRLARRGSFGYSRKHHSDGSFA